MNKLTFSGGRLSSLKRHGVLLIKNSKKPLSNHSSARAARNYQPVRIVGKGAFGVVYCAKSQTGETFAIKKVLQDPRYKNRELDIISIIHHPNCIEMKDKFKTRDQASNDVFLNIVMEYLPMTFSEFAIHYRNRRLYPPILFVKLFAFQMFCGLNYIHSLDITHRDIKPQNILVDVENGILKICDFGSAKIISENEQSVSYIASRYYRAPELVLDCVHYGPSIDIWASGCVIAEVIQAGMPMFTSETSFGQIDAIISILGYPEQEDLNSFPHSRSPPSGISVNCTLKEALPTHTPDDILDLLSKIFVYNPSKRPTAYECMQHPCFDEIFGQNLILPSGKPFPTLNRNPIKPRSKLCSLYNSIK